MRLSSSAGLEYLDQNGRFTFEAFADDSKQIELHRFVDMAAEGWWSGDLDVRRPAADIELLMSADDLHVAEVISEVKKVSGTLSKVPDTFFTRFDGNRYYNLMAGSVTRPAARCSSSTCPPH